MLDPVDPLVEPRLGDRLVQVAGQGVAEDVADQRGLARPRDPRHADEQAERDRDIHVLEVVLAGADDGQPAVGRGASGLRDCDRTLLMAMAGLERADSGTIRVEGQDIGALGEDALARFRGQRIGIVFQSFHLIPTMTALENVAVPLELAGQRDAFARAKAELDAVGLATRARHYPAQLSGGEQQRVALARAIAPRPAILVADEPTGNLDEATGASIVELMFALRRERGATLVLVTHDLTLAARCDRTIRLRSGRVEAGAAPPAIVAA